LAFGVEGVEGEGGFSGTAQTGNDHQLLPRQFHVEILQIVLARTTDLNNLRRHQDDKSRTYQSSTALSFLQRKSRFMNEPSRTVSPEELVELQKKFSDIKHSINNALAVVQAVAEMSQRRPDYAEKLATTVISKVPQIVSGLQEFAQLLNEKAGVKPAAEAK
jgi:hypothetical protein